jgi:hypothetical protein
VIQSQDDLSDPRVRKARKLRPSSPSGRPGGRKIIAGVTNDMCTVFPVLNLVRERFEVQVVADAGGSPSKMADDMALRRSAAA